MSITAYPFNSVKNTLYWCLPRLPLFKWVCTPFISLPDSLLKMIFFFFKFPFMTLTFDIEGHDITKVNPYNKCRGLGSYTVNMLGWSALLKSSSKLLKTMDPASNPVLTHSYSGWLLSIDWDCSCELCRFRFFFDHQWIDLDHQYILIHVD